MNSSSSDLNSTNRISDLFFSETIHLFCWWRWFFFFFFFFLWTELISTHSLSFSKMRMWSHPVKKIVPEFSPHLWKESLEGVKTYLNLSERFQSVKSIMKILNQHKRPKPILCEWMNDWANWVFFWKYISIHQRIAWDVSESVWWILQREPLLWSVKGNVWGNG